MAKRDLRILASEIIPIDEKIKYYAIEFPVRWYEELSNIYKIIKGKEKIQLPYSSLNESLESLPLGIVETGFLYKNNNGYHRPWIISMEELNKNILLKLVRSWCSIELINKEDIEEDLRDKVIDIIESFKVEDIIIEEKFLDLSIFNVLENGTVNPNEAIYNILGNYITQEISEKQIPIYIEGEVLYFIKHKNKIVSFPPKEYKGSYYSVNISFEVKTIVGYKRAILLIDTGISRWANGKFADNIGWKNKTSVLIKYNKNILDSHSIGFTFGSDRITKNYKEQSYVWADDVKEILEDATLAYLPEVDKMLTRSVDYLSNKEDYTLLIAYNNDNTSGINHPVKKGMSMEEKYTICKQLNERFKFLQPIAQNEYKNISRQYSGSRLKDKKHEIGEYLDEIALKEKEINIEIIYINKNTPKLIVREILESIDEGHYINQFVEKDKVTFNYKGLKLNINSILAGDLVEPMKDFSSKVKEVVNFLPKSDIKTLTVVEIKDKKDYSNNDPKFAIRKGLYKVNRINQFINTNHINELEQENDKKRKKAEEKIKPLIKNVILELFRQLGIMHDEINLKGLKGMQKDLEIIGFNLLSTNRSKYKDTLSFPVAVSIRTGEKDIYVKTPVNDWMLYNDAILKLGADNNQKLYNDNEINTFFRGILNDANEDDSLVLVDTSNRLNTIFKDFQDKNIKFNGVYNEYKNVRLIRVKNNFDVPKIVGVNNDDKAYFTSGVKQIVENVFYSAQGKETTYQQIWESHRKLNSPSKEFKIPGTLEIVPVKLNKDDNVESFVYFTHILRNLNITYGDLSSVPVVNHLAKSFQEVLLVKDIEDEE